ncbi:very-long-chain aldehyde decarbonylase GL1-10-like isoform X2 [Wolffia australiana]
MLPYTSQAAAEAALGRALTAAESLWFRYSANVPDWLLYCHNILFLFLVFTLVPLPLAMIELKFPHFLLRYKIQPKSHLPIADFRRCYVEVLKVFFLAVGPLQLLSFPMIKLVGIRTGLPLPSLGEIFCQLLVYFLVEDYGNYWLHRFLHCKWGYEKIHRVHHEFTAPVGFAAPYAHWTEVLILGIPSFAGPAIAPGHMITFWLWIALRQMEAIETHSGLTSVGRHVTCSVCPICKPHTP